MDGNFQSYSQKVRESAEYNRKEFMKYSVAERGRMMHDQLQCVPNGRHLKIFWTPKEQERWREENDR